MGVLGAFIFAAQMINFTIPATGSSGHLGGGMMLAILLGPHAAFLTMASILTVQALVFADGGLLALGCNVFNLGFFPCFVAYPLYRKLAGDQPGKGLILMATVFASVLALQMGALGVVFETVASGISDLPFLTFALMMLPIHLAIGIVEGLATGAVVGFVKQARPEILDMAVSPGPAGKFSLRNFAIAFIILTVITGGALSWFASTNPDGLEWAMFHVSGKEELSSPQHGLYSVLAELQEKTALLPDYNFKSSENKEQANEETWPAVSAGTSFSGMLGAVTTMLLIGLIGLGLKKYRRSVR